MTPLDPAALLAESREELERADGKASMLLSAFGVAVGVIAAALLAGDWSPDRLSHAYRIIWWVGLGITAVGSFCLCSAVWPRVMVVLPGPAVRLAPLLRRLGAKRVLDQEPANASYFDEIAILRSAERVKAGLANLSAEERAISQLIAISVIARCKYLLIRRAMVLLGIALTLVLIAVIAGR